MKKVELIFPVVKVTVRDISNLRSIAATDGVKCAIDRRDMERLHAFSLVETVKLPPCPKEIAEYERKSAEAEKMLRSAIHKSTVDWGLVGKANNLMPAGWSKPKERTRTQLTKAALKLLNEGHAQVEIQQPC